MRLAVITRDKLSVFDGRKEVAAYSIDGPLSPDDVELARTDSLIPQIITVFPRHGTLGMPSPYSGA